MKVTTPSFAIPGIPQVLVADYHNTLQSEPRIVGNVTLPTPPKEPAHARKQASHNVLEAFKSM